MLRPPRTNLRRLSAPLAVKRLQLWGGGSTHMHSILNPKTSGHGWGKKPGGKEDKRQLIQMIKCGTAGTPACGCSAKLNVYNMTFNSESKANASGLR